MSMLCKQFLNNPRINPRTGRQILPTGQVYKKLVKECGEPDYDAHSSRYYSDIMFIAKKFPWTRRSPKISMTRKNPCEEFLKNPHINPRTRRQISPEGNVYKKLMRECSTPSRAQSRARSRARSRKHPCEEFLKNSNINPKTGRKISPEGNVYKKLVRECERYRRRKEVIENLIKADNISVMRSAVLNQLGEDANYILGISNHPSDLYRWVT